MPVRLACAGQGRARRLKGGLLLLQKAARWQEPFRGWSRLGGPRRADGRQHNSESYLLAVPAGDD